MADQGGISDWAILNQTHREEDPQASAGWQAAGEGLGSELSGQGAPGGPGTLGGQLAFEKGQQTASATVNAMAEARLRTQTADANETMARTFEDPTFNPMGIQLSPDMRALYASLARSGHPEYAEAIVNSFAAQIKAKSTAELHDANTSPDQRQRDLQTLAPGSFAPRETANGQGYFNPAIVGQPGTEQGATAPPPGAPGPAGPGAPLYMSPAGQAAEAANTNEKNAQAAAAGQRGAETDKPPAGYAWVTNPDGTKKLDENSMPQLQALTGGPHDPNAPPVAGSRERMILSRIQTSAARARTELQNITGMPHGATTGVLGVGSVPSHSLLQTTTDYMRNSLSDEDTQQMAVAANGLGRALAGIETAGLVPNGTFTQQMEQYAPRAGDTDRTILYKLANIKQIVHDGADVVLQDPATPHSWKAQMQGFVDQVDKLVPYEPQDVLTFGHEGKSGETFEAYLQRKHIAALPVDQTKPGANGVSPSDQELINRFLPKGGANGGPQQPAAAPSY